MPKTSKDKDLFKHVKRRFYLRFNVLLTPELERNIVRLIQSQKTKHIDRQSDNISRHRFELGEHIVDVIYDKKRQCLVTAMYPDEVWQEMYGG